MNALLRLVDIPAVVGSLLSSDPHDAISSLLGQGTQATYATQGTHGTHATHNVHARCARPRSDWSQIAAGLQAKWQLGVFLVVWFMIWSRAWAHIWHMLVREREYMESTARKHMHDTLVQASGWRWAVVLATDVVNRTRMPTVVISPTYLITVRNERVGISGAVEHTATVWRWRWLPPVVPDPTVGVDTSCFSEGAKANTITVLERQSNRCDDARLTSSDEVALSSRMPSRARANAKCAADAMAARYRANDGDGCVFVLHGTPGAGKSTAVRALALALGGRLLADYDPTRNGDCLHTVIGEWADKDAMLVVAVEEFDIALRNIIAGVTVPEDAVLDAFDKSSFNKLVDMVHRKKNVVMVMTTNRSPAELHDICNGDPSLLRPGRVDSWFPFDDVSAPLRTSSCASSTAGASSADHDSAKSVASSPRRRGKPSHAASKQAWRY